MVVKAFAPAKINLTLHVTGQRDDGYHLLDSLVAFADIGDRIRATHAPDLSLSVRGAMARGVPCDDSNLMIQAARLFDPDLGAALELEKHLPPSSGIGGGSSDAAATLRALSTLWQIPLPQPNDTLALGADVPVCMRARTCRMSGIGDVLADTPPLPPLEVVLVNPGVSVSTPSVFQKLQSRDNPAMSARLPNWPDAASFCNWLQDQRNDLQAPAIALQPVIARTLAALADSDCLHAGMSGSGATCFALYPATSGRAKAACEALRRAQPNWWAAHGSLL